MGDGDAGFDGGGGYSETVSATAAGWRGALAQAVPRGQWRRCSGSGFRWVRSQAQAWEAANAAAAAVSPAPAGTGWSCGVWDTVS
ncbi:hypothetical protein Pen01_00500 [Phytomonospora endophytica]|nr:hypothetical protein Pen01_00500 [Phytomonospora endophytica]